MSGWTNADKCKDTGYAVIVGEDLDAAGNVIPDQKYGEKWFYLKTAQCNSTYAMTHPGIQK